MKRSLLVGLLATLLGLGSSAAALTTDVYVDAVNGSDATGNGSAAAPWRTITHANSVATQKALIHVLPGVYDAALGESFPITPKWPDVAGIVGVDAATCILDGGDTAAQLVRLELVATTPEHWRLSRLTLRNARAGFGAEINGHVVGTADVDEVRFERIGLVQPIFWGAALHAYAYTTTDFRIQATNCTFSRCTVGLVVQGVGAPATASAASSMFEDCDSGAVAAAATSSGSASAHMSLDACRFARCTTGVNGSASADMPSGTAYGWIEIERSLFTGCETAIRAMDTVALFARHTTISRNAKGIDSPFGILWSSIVWGNTQFDVSNEFQVNGGASYSNTAPLLAGTGNLSVDPQFANPALGDFHLLAGSPLIDVGDPIFTSGTDADLDPLTLDGNANGSARRDMGFDEYGLVKLAASSQPQLGSTLGFDVQAPAGWSWVLAFATNEADVALGAWAVWGSLLLDPSAFAIVAVGAAPGAPSFAVPNDPALHGAQFHAQAFGWQALPAPASFGNRLDLQIL